MPLDPRLVGLCEAGPKTLSYLRRQPSRPSPAFAAQVLLDEVTMALLQDPRLSPKDDDVTRAGREVHEAYAMWREQGWIDDPASYHRDPPSPRVRDQAIRTRRHSYDLVTFEHGYEPHDGEPGRARWMGRDYHRLARAALIRTRSPGRPWLICVHGFGMGHPPLDLSIFRARWLERQHELNLAFPILPSHGDRRGPGLRTGEGFMSVNVLDGVHGLAQAAWEIRALIRWIRETDPGSPIGIHGISLGGLMASIVASLEPGLELVVAAIPVADLFGLYQRNTRARERDEAVAAGLMGPEADAVGSVVCPLHLTPKVPHAGRYVIAGSGDRMSTAEQAELLWQHWERPHIEWFPGSHVGYFFTPRPGRVLSRALEERLLPGPTRRAP